MLSLLFDIESVGNQILVTAAGNNQMEQLNEAVSKSLLALWSSLRIQDIEAIE